MREYPVTRRSSRFSIRTRQRPRDLLFIRKDRREFGVIVTTEKWLDLGSRNYRILRAERFVQRIGSTKTYSPHAVSGPIFQQIQRPRHHPGAPFRPQEGHCRDLAIGDLPSAPLYGARHADPVLTRLWKTRIVAHEHPSRTGSNANRRNL
jgi:hypothetical protein